MGLNSSRGLRWKIRLTLSLTKNLVNLSVLKMSISYPHLSQKPIWLHTFLTTTSTPISSTCNSVLTTCCQIQGGKKQAQKQNLSFLLTPAEFLIIHTHINPRGKQKSRNVQEKLTGIIQCSVCPAALPSHVLGPCPGFCSRHRFA